MSIAISSTPSGRDLQIPEEDRNGLDLTTSTLGVSQALTLLRIIRVLCRASLSILEIQAPQLIVSQIQQATGHGARLNQIWSGNIT